MNVIHLTPQTTAEDHSTAVAVHIDDMRSLALSLEATVVGERYKGTRDFLVHELLLRLDSLEQLLAPAG
jgi:hypothetical protein